LIRDAKCSSNAISPPLLNTMKAGLWDLPWLQV
jgi:hypothetical protein